MTAALRGDHMERKKYTAPETEIVEFETTDIIKESDPDTLPVMLITNE